jgi:hypothetical protein
MKPTAFLGWLTLAETLAVQQSDLLNLASRKACSMLSCIESMPKGQKGVSEMLRWTSGEFG